MHLGEIQIGQRVRITALGGEGALRQHILDMGLLPGAEVSLMGRAPLGDPLELRVHDYVLTLREADAARIAVEPLPDPAPAPENPTAQDRKEIRTPAPHPGLGEGGRHHPKDQARILPPGTKINLALVGNPNCGKTTLFNRLTGAHQHVGNFPGVTVDKKEGPVRGAPGAWVTDLPGIYSLSPYSKEEMVSRHFILHEKPAALINIIDAGNIERNLYLSLQLLELGIPMVLALNMMDEVRAGGGSIRVNELESLLGIPVVPITANRGQGIAELLEHALHVAVYQEGPLPHIYADDLTTGVCTPGPVCRGLQAVEHLIEDHAAAAGLPLRFAASKVLEADPDILQSLALDPNELELLEHLVLQMEKESGLDRAAAIASRRYAAIFEICRRCVVKPHQTRALHRSRRIDRVLTGRRTALPAFALMMAAIFWLTFGPLGNFLSGALETGIGHLTAWVARGLENYGINPTVQSLVIDGAFAGVGTVLSFLPYILVLFFFLSLLEDSGYLARVAFVMDKLLRRIGLSGRSVVPLLVGFGCTVPAVMATRTLPSERDRKLTVLLTPFMSCTAKLPVYALFAAAFFPHHAAWVMVGLYALGVLGAIGAAAMLRRLLFRGEPVPFVMELPSYRLPGLTGVAKLLWEKAKDFISKAFTIIFVASLVIWFLQSFDLHLNVVSHSSESILAALAGILAPLFAPLGFGHWALVTALLTGFMAKESVVSTLTVLVGAGAGALSGLLSPAGALSFLVFVLLYTPCVAAVSAVRRELGGAWALGMVVGQCLLAWLGAWGAYTLAGLFF